MGFSLPQAQKSSHTFPFVSYFLLYFVLLALCSTVPPLLTPTPLIIFTFIVIFNFLYFMSPFPPVPSLRVSNTFIFLSFCVSALDASHSHLHVLFMSNNCNFLHMVSSIIAIIVVFFIFLFYDFSKCLVVFLSVYCQL